MVWSAFGSFEADHFLFIDLFWVLLRSYGCRVGSFPGFSDSYWSRFGGQLAKGSGLLVCCGVVVDLFLCSLAMSVPASFHRKWVLRSCVQAEMANFSDYVSRDFGGWL